MTEVGRCFYCESSLDLAYQETISGSLCYYCTADNQMYLQIENTCEYIFLKTILGKTNTLLIQVTMGMLKRRHNRAKEMKNAPTVIEREGAWEKYISRISKEDRNRKHYEQLLIRTKEEIKKREKRNLMNENTEDDETLRNHRMDVAVLEKITNATTHPLRLKRIHSLVIGRKGISVKDKNTS